MGAGFLVRLLLIMLLLLCCTCCTVEVDSSNDNSEFCTVKQMKRCIVDYTLGINFLLVCVHFLEFVVGGTVCDASQLHRPWKMVVARWEPREGFRNAKGLESTSVASERPRSFSQH